MDGAKVSLAERAVNLANVFDTQGLFSMMNIGIRLPNRVELPNVRAS